MSAYESAILTETVWHKHRKSPYRIQEGKKEKFCLCDVCLMMMIQMSHKKSHIRILLFSQNFRICMHGEHYIIHSTSKHLTRCWRWCWLVLHDENQWKMNPNTVWYANACQNESCGFFFWWLSSMLSIVNDQKKTAWFVCGKQISHSPFTTNFFL